MLGGPYELDIGDVCVDAAGATAAELPVAWHILIASIWQLPPADGDCCMFVISIVGGCACLLEHDAAQIPIATRRASLPVPASLDL